MMATQETQYEKFLPYKVPEAHMPFWESLRDHAVKVQRCVDCGRYRHIPKDICSNCHSERATWSPISGQGEIHTYTIVHRAPTPAYQEEAPYALVHVTMEEGFRMFAKLLTDDPESVEIGMQVKAAYEDITPEWTLLLFEAA